MKLVKQIYQCTQNFPKSELFSLTDQIKRASVSIPSNLAEGQRRRSVKDFLQFSQIAFGSAAEVDTQLEIAYELGFIPKDKYAMLADQVEIILKMLNKLTHSLYLQTKTT